MKYAKHSSLERDLLKKIIKNKNFKAWEFARNYAWNDKKMFLTHNEENSYYTGKENLIKHYLKKLINNGTIIENKQGDCPYNFLKTKLRFTKSYKFHDTVAEAISVKDKNNKWTIYQI